MIQAILEHVAGFLADSMTREEFEDWFLPVIWNLDQLNDPDAYALAGQITLALAEFDDGHLDGVELRARLAEIAAPSRVR
jgi:hypothetical protein